MSPAAADMAGLYAQIQTATDDAINMPVTGITPEEWAQLETLDLRRAALWDQLADVALHDPQTPLWASSAARESAQLYRERAVRVQELARKAVR